MRGPEPNPRHRSDELTPHNASTSFKKRPKANPGPGHRKLGAVEDTTLVRAGNGELPTPSHCNKRRQGTKRSTTTSALPWNNTRQRGTSLQAAQTSQNPIKANSPKLNWPEPGPQQQKQTASQNARAKEPGERRQRQDSCLHNASHRRRWSPHPNYRRVGGNHNKRIFTWGNSGRNAPTSNAWME